MAEETKDKKPAAKPADSKAKAKKEKPPAIEEKPFQEFISEHFIPNLKETLENQGVADLDLKFEKRTIPIKGFEKGDECWQVIGTWKDGQRTFFLAFPDEEIKGAKFYAAADNGAHPTTLESFMIDERRVNLDLMVFYVVQRLNGQKWLTRN
ncbi:MAG: DUF2996 domain-containing protein [Elainellaceae cyanobacterium]